MDTPDFDHYPTARRVRATTVLPLGLEAHWDDGAVTTHHALWLRENALDPETTNPDTREQALQLVDIPGDLRVLSASPSQGGGLSVRFTDGAEAQYHPGWLRAYARETQEAPFALPPRRLWSGESPPDLPRFPAAAFAEDEAVFEAWGEALYILGFAILEGVTPKPGQVERIAQRLGPLRESNFGRIFDVRTATEQTSNAYTAMALPVHADLCTREHMPGLQFLHCLENSTVGGATRLTDGFQLAETLRQEDPHAFHTLSTEPLLFANKAEDSDYRWEAPLIGLDAKGALQELRFSPWLRGPLSTDLETTDRIYRALRALFRRAEAPGAFLRFTLKAGDLLAFDNARLLHGREAFDGNVGSRWLQGCYGAREELHSQLRMQSRRRRRSL
jgi:gamma-butyrobetaine dioxygenase